jgi:predicted nuclease with RNAse H fold
VINLKIIGIDLAGSVNNPTGICLLKDAGLEFKILNCDEDILKTCFDFKPDIIAIDAPIIDGIPRIRKADKILKKYKALSPSLPSMKILTMRGSKLAKKLSENYKVIEVFPTATAKILGIYSKNYKEIAKKLNIEIKNKHELDAYLCCLTAKLFLEKKVVQIGDSEGKITIPK